MGGPGHAVAALAYGTESIPSVDKIVGPGNAYVNEAKLLVSRDVAIDLPAGPSCSSSSAAAATGGSPSSRSRRKPSMGRAPSARSSRQTTSSRRWRRWSGGRPSTSSCSALRTPRIRNAGAVFVGHASPVAAGDLGTGANHVLPTGGRARTGVGLETLPSSPSPCSG